MKTQGYSEEEGSIWEDVKHGLVYGSQDFVRKIRDPFLTPGKNAEPSQRNSMFSDISPEEIVVRTCDFMNFNMETARQARRMVSSDKDKRDFIMYLLRDMSALSNQKIGSVFNLTHSSATSASRRVKELSVRFQKYKKLLEQYQALKSKIKV